METMTVTLGDERKLTLRLKIFKIKDEKVAQCICKQRFILVMPWDFSFRFLFILHSRSLGIRLMCGDGPELRSLIN